MSHLDEGMLHELLDGELSPDDARAARAHLATCAECRVLYQEAKEFFEESERLVTALDGARELGSRRPAVPPSRLARPRRRLPLHTLAWAASIFLAISLGYYGSDFRRKTSAEAAKLADTAVSPSGNLELLPGAALKDSLPVADTRTAPPGAAETAPKAITQRRQAQPATPPAPVGRPVPMRTDQAAGGRAEPTAPREEDRLRGQAENVAADQRLAEADQGAQGAVAQSAQPAAPVNAAAKVAAPSPAPLFRKVPMEEAVSTLGGTIRLIGGLTPERVETVGGQLVTGARPDLPVVRVIYVDPPRREIWLDQQHGVGGMPAVADTILVPSPNGAQSLQWRPAPGEWLSLTGFLTADSLKALARRVK